MNGLFSSESRGARWRKRRAPWVILGLLAPGCVLDSDDRCGENQRLSDDETSCVCAEGFAYTPQGCLPCGENEVAGPAGCVCAPGYGRSDPAEACAEIPEGIGTPCNTAAECLNPSFNHCQISPLGEGYCTSTGCASSADCTGGYACDTTTGPSYCKRPPVGAGKTCAVPEDCADTEALFCDNFVTFSCLEMDCTREPDSCFPGTECCPFGPIFICVGAGLCAE